MSPGKDESSVYFDANEDTTKQITLSPVLENDSNSQNAEMRYSFFSFNQLSHQL